MAIVYCFTNKTNNKKYIGMTIRTLEERIESHKYEAYNALDAVGKLHGNVDGKHRKHGKIA